jgi:hypothetical protein
MILYASRTGTRRNLAEMRRYGWRLIVSSEGVWRHEGFKYAIDNGAWTAHQQERPWDESKFLGLLRALGHGADWVVLPDIVCGGMASLERSVSWIDRIPYPKLLPVQDGFEPHHVREYLGSNVGIFVGGSAEWKEETLDIWGALAREENNQILSEHMPSHQRIKADGIQV